MVFDLLRSGARYLSDLPLMKRRAALETLAGKAFQASGLFRLTPASRNYADAEARLNSVNEDHDGVVAKRLDLPYRGGTRDGMQKIKLLRSADCVVGGFRYAEKKQGNRKVVGSLLLGLYDKGGLLHHVGFTSGIRSSDRPALTDRLGTSSGCRASPAIHRAVQAAGRQSDRLNGKPCVQLSWSKYPMTM
jgi:ATP-dependent DNA ligase